MPTQYWLLWSQNLKLYLLPLESACLSSWVTLATLTEKLLGRPWERLLDSSAPALLSTSPSLSSLLLLLLLESPLRKSSKIKDLDRTLFKAELDLVRLRDKVDWLFRDRHPDDL